MRPESSEPVQLSQSVFPLHDMVLHVKQHSSMKLVESAQDHSVIGRG